MLTGGNDCFAKPLEILGHNEASGLTMIDPSGSIIDWLRSITVFVPIVDLAFVALPELTRNASEEDPRIQMFPIAPHPELQNKISKGLGAFDLPWAIRNPELPRFCDFKNALLTWIDRPSFDVSAVE
jgi:hypothetical protein